MPTHKLIFEELEEVELIALRSTEPAYKVVWRLNQAMEMRLRKIGEYVLELGTQPRDTGLFSLGSKAPSFEIFSLSKEEYENESLVLVSNKDEGTELFSEAKGFDMVIFVSSQNHSAEAVQRVLEKQEGTLTTCMITCSSYARLKTPFNYFDL